MAKKKAAKLRAPEPTSKEFETYSPSQVSHYIQSSPSCWNGIVSIRRYRVTVEQIEEPIEVIRERIVDLWRKSNNHHDYDPLQRAAAEYGIRLVSDTKIGRSFELLDTNNDS